MINENHRIPCYKNSTNDSFVVLYVRGAQISGVAMATKCFAMVPNMNSLYGTYFVSPF